MQKLATIAVFAIAIVSEIVANFSFVMGVQTFLVPDFGRIVSKGALTYLLCLPFNQKDKIPIQTNTDISASNQQIPRSCT